MESEKRPIPTYNHSKNQESVKTCLMCFRPFQMENLLDVVAITNKKAIIHMKPGLKYTIWEICAAGYNIHARNAESSLICGLPSFACFRWENL